MEITCELLEEIKSDTLRGSHSNTNQLMFFIPKHVGVVSNHLELTFHLPITCREGHASVLATCSAPVEMHNETLL